MQIQKTKEQPAVIGKPIKVVYKNYRDEVAERIIIPQKIFWGSTEWHKDEQWLLEVFDVERDTQRVYAMKDVIEWLY